VYVDDPFGIVDGTAVCGKSGKKCRLRNSAVSEII
jgi:hypothetical protein